MQSGFLFIDKKEDETSRQVDDFFKKQFKTKKVGHLGTLDPFASGLLIIGINEATKFFPLLEDEKKTYIATLKLGIETDSLDSKGKIIKEEEVKEITIKEIESVFSSFIGKSSQLPPKYSAKRIDGVRAYDLARNNVQFTLEPVEIEVFDLKLLNYNQEENTISFKVCVSKGTYIRSLGLDIARKLNTCGYLTSLRRTNIGTFDVSDALKKEKTTAIIPIESVFSKIKSYEIEDEKLNYVSNGNPLKLNLKEDYLFIKKNKILLALYFKKDNIYYCYRKLNYENN